MAKDIASLRENYAQKKLNEKKVKRTPFLQFGKWWEQAIDAKIAEANAMTLATASADGMPAARVVLLKGFNENGFIFFTNYSSFKGQQLAENPRASLVFFWKELERQVRITGLVEKINETESEAYFHSRPLDSQLGAVASPQSMIIESRKWLDQQFKEVKKANKKQQISKPSHWGGYLVKPIIVEFWQGRPDRLHDRLQYTLQDNGQWKIERLAP